MKKKLLTLTFLTFFNGLFANEEMLEKPSQLFPIYAKEAIEKGYTLPKTYGLNFIYVDMEQNVDVQKINLEGKLFNFIDLSKSVSIEARDTKVKNKNKFVKADFWLFPFLNIYGIAGQTKGTSTSKVDIYLNRPNGTQLQNPTIKDLDFELNYKGDTFGLGAVLAAGTQNFFTLIDANYSRTTFDIVDGNITALVISPKVGYRFDYANTSNSLWFGFMYQDITQTLKGDLNSVITLPDKISLENGKFEIKEGATSPWNTVVGLRSEINSNFEVVLEFGFRKRTSTTLSLGYRF